MADTEKELRHDVALANRIIERFKLSTGFGHVSARIPGTNTFYIPTRRSPGLADENDLLVIDTDGNVLSGTGTPNSEFWIHARIYAAHPEVNGVVHAHPLACVSLTQIGEPHRVVHHMGGVFVDGVPEYERIGLIRSSKLGDDVAKSLGKGVAVMMRGHGITTAFTNVRAATIAAVFLEESADLQVRMLARRAATRLRYVRSRARRRNSRAIRPDPASPPPAALGNTMPPSRPTNRLAAENGYTGFVGNCLYAGQECSSTNSFAAQFGVAARTNHADPCLPMEPERGRRRSRCWFVAGVVVYRAGTGGRDISITADPLHHSVSTGRRQRHTGSCLRGKNG